MPVPETLSLAQARRIALAAQGFDGPRPGAEGTRVDQRHVRRVHQRLDVVQIDSVNVAVRSQEMPLFARLGPHPHDLWERLTRAGQVFESWCHEASLLPIDAWPLLAWRRHPDSDMWPETREVNDRRPEYVQAVLDEVRDAGPLWAGELSDPGHKARVMWERNDGKKALEYLFSTGQVVAWHDSENFTRYYDLTERMIPAEIRALPVPAADDAKRALLDRAGRALGIATDRCLADYHRLNLHRARPLIADLVEDGRLIPIRVRGWKEMTFLHAEARLPRWIRARCLLTPFDSLVWERNRAKVLFGFDYKIEIYVPAPERVHGYYVLPFLLGDRLVARVDAKADRHRRTLKIKAAYGEPGHDQKHVAEHLAAELWLMAGWLGLPKVKIEPKGDLAPVLASAVEAHRA
ncbi:MAG TPA: crosslink repair DNA glycosylase YcaQ family protein [Acidimicrobiales bacterium]|nr:crosslink repair DNA glycosylase YcaQ family protein [Acidimicrobiales bacterium]